MVMRCATCGAIIDPETWTPTRTRYDAEETLEIYRFCCSECRKDWTEASGAEAE